MIFKVLDPRISYSGLLTDCKGEMDSHANLKLCKEQLHSHFHEVYNKPLLAPTVSVTSTATTNNPQNIHFTSCYQSLPQAFTGEVQEYFRLPCKSFHSCNPLKWWAGRHLQFPNLSRFARDILSIPGEPFLANQSIIFISPPHRISCCHQTHFFRKLGHNFPLLCTPQLRHHQNSDVSKAAAAPCLHHTGTMRSPHGPMLPCASGLSYSCKPHK